MSITTHMPRMSGRPLMNLLPPAIPPAVDDTLEPHLLHEPPLAGSGRQLLHGWCRTNKPGELESSDSSDGVRCHREDARAGAGAMHVLLPVAFLLGLHRIEKEGFSGANGRMRMEFNINDSMRK